jgi:hypothetical protein
MGYNLVEQSELARSMALGKDREGLGPKLLEAFGIDTQILRQIPPHFVLAADSGSPIVLDLVGKGFLRNSHQERAAAFELNLINTDGEHSRGNLVDSLSTYYAD